MILVNEFFSVFGVDCPDWLSDELLDDDWLEDCVYSFEDGVHKWIHEDLLRYLVLTFDGELYRMQAFDEDREHVIFEEVITEECTIIT
jgi:hypothetical protein